MPYRRECDCRGSHQPETKLVTFITWVVDTSRPEFRGPSGSHALSQVLGVVSVDMEKGGVLLCGMWGGALPGPAGIAGHWFAGGQEAASSHFSGMYRWSGEAGLEWQIDTRSPELRHDDGTICSLALLKATTRLSTVLQEALKRSPHDPQQLGTIRGEDGAPIGHWSLNRPERRPSHSQS